MAEEKKRHRISYSAVSCFMDCKRKYYFGYKRKIELITFKPQNVVGNCVHHGIYLLFDKDKDYIANTMKIFKNEIKKLRTKLELEPNQEKDLKEQEIVIRGMLNGYAHKYKKVIGVTKHLHNEIKFVYHIDKNVEIAIKMDNIEKVKSKMYVHEIKTTGTLTADYVKGIKNDLQTAIYFHTYNRIHPREKLDGIMYDVIKKPSIRRKKKESPQQYLTRLGDFYKGANQDELFYMEMLEKPLLSDKRVFWLLESVADEMRRCKDDEDYYPNERHCYVYRRCDYYDICHFGENKLIMAKYRNKFSGEKSEEKKD